MTEPERTRYRMRDLVAATGLPRETIHFYLQQRLLPPGTKTGRNTAFYTQEHLERLHKIRDLRDKQFLPLKAIRAVLDGAGAAEGLTSDQEELLRRIRMRVGGWLDPDQTETASVALEATGVALADAEHIASLGLIEIHGTGRGAKITAEDAEILGIWKQLNDIGIGPEQGFVPEHFSIYAEAIERVVQTELAFFTDRYANAEGDRAAKTVEEAVPILNQLLGVLHRKKVREFFS